MAILRVRSKVDIDIEGFIELTDRECDEAAKNAVEYIMEQSKQFIENEAKHPTGKLAGQIKLEKSRFEGGGWAVEAQGRGRTTRFYATFVELGSIKNPQPIPYLRTPLKRSRAFILKQFENII